MKIGGLDVSTVGGVPIGYRHVLSRYTRGIITGGTRRLRTRPSIGLIVSSAERLTPP
jgi:hypothetical protein